MCRIWVAAEEDSVLLSGGHCPEKGGQNFKKEDTLVIWVSIEPYCPLDAKTLIKMEF